ncbi:DUF6081 family protein [Streptomyces sp. NBC_00690]|uniref:DUF6081 family protein n=1 Tax=Streptomyces sp. NBC_00690 TaxID=2975808 RepID=UPI002E29E5ED|nr:DUF6081 family protein [Streptomyces sp. NBC_00690]
MTRAIDAYDDFQQPELDPQRWAIQTNPLAEGGFWTLEEPTAKTTIDGGTLQLRVEKYERFHDTLQICDNPKHLVASTSAFQVAAQGETVFSVEMAVENIGGNPDDFRDAFASFNLIDYETAMIFDHAATSRRTYAIHERLRLPGFDPASAFTWFVEAPLSGLTIDPTEFHEYAIVFDREAGQASWYIDDRLTYEARDIEVPPTLRVGMGLFTLHPLHDGRSVSLRGQGMAGQWRNLRVPERA